MDRKKQRTIYLWSVPRTLSTAFLRAMATVDGCLAIYEPYINAFYKENKNRPDELPSAPAETYEEIRNNLRHEFPGYDMIFIKEMAKHLAGRLDDHSYIPKDCIHTFLIRHPVKTMKSYTSALLRMYERTIPDEEKRKEAVTEYMTADKIRTEQSYVFLNEVYSIVTNVYKQRPVIIDADDLQENPEGTLRVYCKEVGIQYQESMVHWGQITTEQKDVYRHRLDYVPDVAMPFIGKALNSKEFQQGAPLKVSVEETDEKYKAIVEENIPVYEKLKKMRLKPAEDVIESPLP